MQEYDHTSEQERCFYESILEIQKVNKKLAKLLLRKEELTENIIASLGHEHEGQKQYEYGEWKIEVKTPFTYSLNKKLYESGEIELPEEFNPIKESVSYSIDKKLLTKYMDECPEEVREVLIDLIDKKPGKASVCVKERV